MEYREQQPPGALCHLVKAGWTLAVPEGGSGWIEHRLLPDGCVELIRRLAGRSRWGGEQPETFVGGTITGPTRLDLGPGARFVGLRIWPWTWNALARIPAGKLVDRWAGLTEAAPGFDMPRDLDRAFDALASIPLRADVAALAAIILDARSVAEMTERSGRSSRWLQRWFAREVGVPPRLYLRLLRFEGTLAGLRGSGGTLADLAAAHGFADQAHMAREFRTIGGTPAGIARSKARGPFI